MHDCPYCGDVCDCYEVGGDDVWVSWPYTKKCTHVCDPESEDDDAIEDQETS